MDSSAENAICKGAFDRTKQMRALVLLYALAQAELDWAAITNVGVSGWWEHS